MNGQVEVRWAWLFLDLPEDGFDDAVRFWAQVTRSSLSARRGERDEFATLLPEHGDPWLKVQRVGGPGGVHLDLDVDGSPQQAAGRAEALGAEVVADLGEVVVCRSPGGLPFCLGPAGREGDPSRQVVDGRASLLDQVCLDIPADRYDAEVAFWSALTGWRVDPGRVSDELERLAAPAALPLRVLLQRLDDPEGVVRAHADLSCPDRGAEVARHLDLGAVEQVSGRRWTVLRDPAGLTYCVTDRLPGQDPTASPPLSRP